LTCVSLARAFDVARLQGNPPPHLEILSEEVLDAGVVEEMAQVAIGVFLA